jgi:hypothetical protein
VVVSLRLPPRSPQKNNLNADQILEGHGQSAIMLVDFDPQNKLKNGDWLRLKSENV